MKWRLLRVSPPPTKETRHRDLAGIEATSKPDTPAVLPADARTA
jgi:hypothetical protein